MNKFTDTNLEMIDTFDIIEAIEKCYYSVIEKKGNYKQEYGGNLYCRAVMVDVSIKYTRQAIIRR